MQRCIISEDFQIRFTLERLRKFDEVMWGLPFTDNSFFGPQHMRWPSKIQQVDQLCGSSFAALGVLLSETGLSLRRISDFVSESCTVTLTCPVNCFCPLEAFCLRDFLCFPLVLLCGTGWSNPSHKRNRFDMIHSQLKLFSKLRQCELHGLY